ncbi:transcriptional regulator [Methanolobus tindarius DSM 2278]|uniref:Transcriptional regulator n=1 Tax=Methanolobus tindarius DSM 2278 TaxID=1090322 RepID=W9DPV6_METTI|nr:MarR family transcriptional regulator [Methanolobus tindarius]ETA67358.1 transcriptional regulator [Methanolobus tindarius DSM 2278]
MSKDLVRKIFDKHLEHDCFFDKKMLNVAVESSSLTFNTLPNKTIRLIHFKKEINPSRLGIILGVGKSTITSTIDTLEKNGLVVRNNDPDDMRKQLISLTDAGEDYHFELMDMITERVSSISDSYGMSESDLVEYYDHLSQMVSILNKYIFET